MRRVSARAAWILLLGFLTGCMGDSIADRVTDWGKPKTNTATPIRTEAMGRFLADADLETPYLVSATTGKIRRGEVFRENVRDQRGAWTLATVWMDPDEADVLRIQTKRTAVCPECGGTGIRKNAFGKQSDRLSVDFRCLKCNGSGKLENYVEEKRYILSDADLEGRRSRAQVALMDTEERPLGAEEEAKIADLSSADPLVRLAALEWLDLHYVRDEIFFHRLMPMLRKARWIERDDKKGITIYQFWAARDAKPQRAYYRIYVDNRKGEIREKGFVTDDGLYEQQSSGPVDKVEEGANKVKNWFTEGWKEK